jgi:hypothetical protein
MFGPNDASHVWSQGHIFGPSDASNFRPNDTLHVLFPRRRYKGHWIKPAFISENINIVGAGLHRHEVNVGEMWDGGAMILQLLDQRIHNTARSTASSKRIFSSCILE